MALENSFKGSRVVSDRSYARAAMLAACTSLLATPEISAQPARPLRCPSLLSGTRPSREWFENGSSLYNCANQQANPGDRAVLSSLALVAFYHGITDATDAATLTGETRNAIDFNIRAVGSRTFGVVPVRSAFTSGPVPSASEVTAINGTIRANNGVKNANLAAIDGLVNSIVPPGVTVTVTEQPDVLRRAIHSRNLGRIVLEATDRNVRALSQLFLDTLRPLAPQMGVCAQAPQQGSEAVSVVLNRMLCAQGRVLTYEDFLILASYISRQSLAPNGVAWPTVLVEGTPPRTLDAWRMDQLGLSQPNTQVGLQRLIQVLGENFYLLHLYAYLVSNLDSLALRFGGSALFTTLNLTNRMTPEAINRVVRPDTEVSVAQTSSGPGVPVLPGALVVRPVSVESPAHRAWVATVEARNRRVLRIRIAGLSIAGVGLLTGGIAGGINLAQRNEALAVIDMPLWQARIAETNMFLANARAGMYGTSEIEAGNVRTQRYRDEFRAAVEGNNDSIATTQALAWTGLGLAGVGAVLTVLAPVIAGPVPVEPRETNVPAAPGQQGPHPAPAGRRAEVEVPGVGVTPNLAVDATGVNVGATVTF